MLGESASRGLSTLNEDQIAERGARLARRDDREYREYLSEEQRRQPGCPAREVVLDQRGQAIRMGRPFCAKERLPMPEIEARGYAHPEVLVSTEWVAQHLNDPGIRIVESNEDTLL